jgi:alpha-L-rhamnosidase
VFASIVDKTENECGGHVSSGVIGIQILMRTLTEYGRPDLAFKIASDTTYPSWGYMAEHGATTIWELWNGDTANPAMNSGNHVMLLGDLIVWEYEYLAGIRPLKPGYEEIELRPTPIAGLDYVDCSFESVHGRIVSSWKVKDGVFKWTVEVPKGVRAEIWLPGAAEPREIVGGKHRFEVKTTL